MWKDRIEFLNKQKLENAKEGEEVQLIKPPSDNVLIENVENQFDMNELTKISEEKEIQDA